MTELALTRGEYPLRILVDAETPHEVSRVVFVLSEQDLSKRADAARAERHRNTGSMHDQWMHVGRLWTNGEPFLAIDAAHRSAWHGFSNDDFDQVAALGWQDTSVPVGGGRAVLVGADGVVRDDSWIEVFATAEGQLAIVQAAGPDYRDVLDRALGYPVADDQVGGELTVDGGELAIFSAADDGAGPYAGPLVNAQPGPVPPVHGPPSREVDPGLLIPAPHARYKLKVRWYTRLDEDNCFARWLLIPVQADD